MRFKKIVIFSCLLVWNPLVSLTLYPGQMKETKYEDHQHHVKEV